MQIAVMGNCELSDKHRNIGVPPAPANITIKTGAKNPTPIETW